MVGSSYVLQKPEAAPFKPVITAGRFNYNTNVVMGIFFKRVTELSSNPR